VLVAGSSSVTMRASFDVCLGRMKSFGGFEVASGSGLVEDGAGSGVGSFGPGFARVALAMLEELCRTINALFVSALVRDFGVN
jgi:hypothetical protein